MEKDFGTRERGGESSEGFDAATIIVEPCEEIEPSGDDDEKIVETKSLGKRDEELESDNDGFTDEGDTWGKITDANSSGKFDDRNESGTEDDELKEEKLSKGWEMLGENEIGGAGDGGFITEDGGFMTESVLGFTVEDGVGDALGWREKDLKKFVIEFEGRRRFGILKIEEFGFEDEDELGVVEERVERATKSEAEGAEGESKEE